MEHNPWKTLTERLVYANPWIKLTHREVLNPAGKPGIYGVVHFQNQAIGIVPVDDEEHTWLVGQYRYTTGRYSWEIPEGGCPQGEEPLAAAKRELKEETGLVAERWEVLLPEFHVSNSVTDERGMIFLATGLEEGEWAPDETELLQLRRMPLREAADLVRAGEIQDLMSVAALLRAEQLLPR